MTKVQMEQRIKDLEGEVKVLQTKLDTSKLIAEEATGQFDAQEKKINHLKIVLRDLLISEYLEEQVMTIGMQVKLEEAIKKVLEEERVYEPIFIVLKPNGALIVDTRSEAVLPHITQDPKIIYPKKEGLL